MCVAPLEEILLLYTTAVPKLLLGMVLQAYPQFPSKHKGIQNAGNICKSGTSMLVLLLPQEKTVGGRSQEEACWGREGWLV